MPKPITHQIRQIMRAHDRRNNEIWTNRYQRSISIKCYASGVDRLDSILLEHLERCCRRNNIAARVYMLDNPRSNMPASIIVSIPQAVEE